MARSLTRNLVDMPNPLTFLLPALESLEFVPARRIAAQIKTPSRSFPGAVSGQCELSVNRAGKSLQFVLNETLPANNAHTYRFDGIRRGVGTREHLCFVPVIRVILSLGFRVVLFTVLANEEIQRAAQGANIFFADALDVQ